MSQYPFLPIPTAVQNDYRISFRVMKCLDTCSYVPYLVPGRQITAATLLFYDIMIIKGRKYVEWWCGSEPNHGLVRADGDERIR